MAGEWIKMRTNLWTDPRVSRLCDLTGQAEVAVIGGLYWLWASADDHSLDGVMPGLSIAGIDRRTGIAGFGSALVAIGWIAETDGGITIAKFDEHNGASAKKRAQIAKRVANHRSGNADVTHDATDCNAPSVTGALARYREEEEKEESPKPNGFGEGRASARGPSDPRPVEVNGDLLAAAGGLNGEPPPPGMHRRRRASRVAPQDFEVTQDLRAWAQAEFPGVDVNAETEKFRDHEFRDAHADWERTWRNWIRKAAQFAPRAASKGGVSQSLLDAIRNDPRCQGLAT